MRRREEEREGREEGRGREKEEGVQLPRRSEQTGRGVNKEGDSSLGPRGRTTRAGHPVWDPFPTLTSRHLMKFRNNYAVAIASN